MIILLTISLLILTVLSLYLCIRQFRNKLIVFVLIPFLLFNVGFSWHTINTLWGTAKLGRPVVEVQLLYATVLKPYIFILVKEDQAEPVLHKILYSQEAEKQIMRAMGQARRGVKMLLKPSESDSQGNEDLKFYQFDHKASEPKVP